MATSKRKKKVNTATRTATPTPLNSVAGPNTVSIFNPPFGHVVNNPLDATGGAIPVQGATWGIGTITKACAIILAGNAGIPNYAFVEANGVCLNLGDAGLGPTSFDFASVPGVVGEDFFKVVVYCTFDQGDSPMADARDFFGREV